MTKSKPREAKTLTLAEIIATERFSSLLLALSAVAALLWASLSPESYASFWTTSFASTASLAHGSFSTPGEILANGFMVIFFFTIGLELARERATKNSEHGHASLPVIAAVGGMLGAATLYLLVILIARGSGIELRGWPIPTATDVAFSLGALGLAGRYLPSGLRPFLLTLAVADDLLAVLLLGVVGTQHGETAYLLLALVLALALFSLSRVGLPWPLVICFTAGLFVSLAAAGIEPILAGAIGGLCVPRREPRQERSAEQLERWSERLSSLIILPLFILSAAGVCINGQVLQGTGLVFVAIVLSRTLGKGLGVAGSALLAARITGLALPLGLSLQSLLGLGLLCGVGLTVPLLFATSIYPAHPDYLRGVQVGLLVASLAAGVIGISLLRHKHSGKDFSQG